MPGWDGVVAEDALGRRVVLVATCSREAVIGSARRTLKEQAGVFEEGGMRWGRVADSEDELEGGGDGGG